MIEKRTRSYYAPYDDNPAFDRGVNDYNNWAMTRFRAALLNPFDHTTTAARAWDCGREYASYLYHLKQVHRETD